MLPYGPVDAAFEEARLSRQIQSFDDQLPFALKALLHDPSERQHARRAFDYILVDEFQDLNEAQLALIDVLTRPDRELMVVGDDDQLIYGWRYARLGNILDFEKCMPDASTVVLETNYRCAIQIVQASRRVIDNNKERVAKNIRAGNDAPEGMVLYAADKEWGKRSIAIVDFLRGSHARTGKWRSSAVLCRTKAQQQIIAMALDQAVIPRSRILQYRLFTDTKMDLVRTYLKLALDPGAVNGSSLARVINRPNRFAKTALRDLLNNSAQPWEALVQHLASTPQEDEYRVRSLQGFVNTINRWHRDPKLKNSPADELINELATDVGLIAYWTDLSDGGNKDAQDGNPLELFDLIKLHAADLVGAKQLLSYWDDQARIENEKDRHDASDSLKREEDDSLDAVVISTIHASKGREYESVVLPDYCPDIGKMSTSMLEEERRVFYVGMTRAKYSLLLTIADPVSVNKFIRESIRPPRLHEESEVLAEVARLIESGKTASAEVSRRNNRIKEAQDGTLLAELKIRRSNLNGQHTVAQGVAGDLKQQVAECGFFSRVSGKLKRLEKGLAEANAQVAVIKSELATIEQDILLLEDDVDRFLEPLIRDHMAAVIELLRLDDKRAQADNRLIQIHTLW